MSTQKVVGTFRLDIEKAQNLLEMLKEEHARGKAEGRREAVERIRARVYIDRDLSLNTMSEDDVLLPAERAILRILDEEAAR